MASILKNDVQFIVPCCAPWMLKCIFLYASYFFIVSVKITNKKARQYSMDNVTISVKANEWFLSAEKSLILDVWLHHSRLSVTRGKRAAHGATCWSNAEVFTLLVLIDKTNKTIFHKFLAKKSTLFTESIPFLNYVNFKLFFQSIILLWVTADLFSRTFPIPQHDLNKAERIRMQIEFPNLCINSNILNLSVLGSQIFGSAKTC